MQLILLNICNNKNNYIGNAFFQGQGKMNAEKEIIQKIELLSDKKYIKLTERCNHSIRSALALAKDLGYMKVLIQDQGGWLTYKEYPLEYGMEIIELKTDYGLVDLHDLDEKADFNSVLLINSMPGYCATEDVKEVYKICKAKNCLMINDASGTIGRAESSVGDIIVGSFGRWKPINNYYGGFIATDNKEWFDAFIAKFDESKSKSLLEKIDALPKHLAMFEKTRKKVLSDLKSFDIIHPKAKGINVIVKYKDDAEKQKLVDYCKTNKLEFTECPRYIRVMEKAVSVEIKRL
jgi:hypothetical protein